MQPQTMWGTRDLEDDHEGREPCLAGITCSALFAGPDYEEQCEGEGAHDEREPDEDGELSLCGVSYSLHVAMSDWGKDGEDEEGDCEEDYRGYPRRLDAVSIAHWRKEARTPKCRPARPRIRPSEEAAHDARSELDGILHRKRRLRPCADRLTIIATWPGGGIARIG